MLVSLSSSKRVRRVHILPLTLVSLNIPGLMAFSVRQIMPIFSIAVAKMTEKSQKYRTMYSTPRYLTLKDWHVMTHQKV